MQSMHFQREMHLAKFNSDNLDANCIEFTRGQILKYTMYQAANMYVVPTSLLQTGKHIRPNNYFPNIISNDNFLMI